MRADEFREQVQGRVPAWDRYRPALERVITESPSPRESPEIMLKPESSMLPLEVSMLLEVLGWSGELLVCRVVVGGPMYFGATFHLNPRFFRFFQLYVVNPTEILRSAELR